MIRSVSEIRGVTDPEILMKLEGQFDKDLHDSLRDLMKLLSQNVMSLDHTSLHQHMCTVESWRSKLVILLSLATAFTEHAKSETFLRKKQRGEVGQEEQKAHQRHMSCGFQAQVVLLEGTIACVDSRTNLCKKLTGLDFEGARTKAA